MISPGNALSARLIVSPQAWQAAREAMLVKEKALTRARDALAAERLRGIAVDGGGGHGVRVPRVLTAVVSRSTCSGRRLIVYRAFFWSVGGRLAHNVCCGCSFGADQFNLSTSTPDTTLVYASLARRRTSCAALKAVMCLACRYTITDASDADFGVDEWPQRVHPCDGETVFRTYFTSKPGRRGDGTTWNFLDVTPLGRQEDLGRLACRLSADAAYECGGTGMTNMSRRRARR